MKTTLPILAILVLAVTGCTHVQKVAVNPTQFATANPTGKANNRVNLMLDDEFRNYKYQFGLMGDTFVYPLGELLDRYARDVAAAVLPQITVKTNAGEVAAAGTDVQLQVRVVKFDQAMPVTAFGDRKLLLIVEWTLKDRTGQNTLWLATITGQSTEQAGNAFTFKKHEKAAFQKLFDDLGRKTHAALTAAEEIKRLTK